MHSLQNSKLLAAAILALGIFCPWHSTEGRRVRVTHNAAAADTIHISDPHSTTLTDSLPLASALRLSGYDKNRESNRESLFVTNRDARTLTSLTLQINYNASDGRQLHQRRVKIKCHIPPGETRIVDFRSWDRQNSFYYRRSRRPARTQATPYAITVLILAGTFTD